MIGITKGVSPSEVRQSGRHVLFVEGGGDNPFDPLVIANLFGGIENIEVKALGPSYSLRSVAESLYKHHPSYYFLIDRDHYDDSYIEHCWDSFPNPETSNLLIWRYREIENYFLDPTYLMNSRFIVDNVDKDMLEKDIRQLCQKRLYIDAANHVIVSVREELKQTWIETFSNPDEFISREKTLSKLLSADEFNVFNGCVATKLDRDGIANRFDNILQEMTGGTEGLESGVGKWLMMIRGKKILPQIVNSKHFNVRDQKGNPLQGRDKLQQVANDLLKQPPDIQPEDFRRLRGLIMARLDS